MSDMIDGWKPEPDDPTCWHGPGTEMTAEFNGRELIAGREDDHGQGWVGVYVPLDVVKALLATHGLRVVTEKDAAALEAMSAISDDTLRSWITRGFETVLPLAKAELARRAAFHSGEQSAPESAAAAENTLKTR